MTRNEKIDYIIKSLYSTDHFQRLILNNLFNSLRNVDYKFNFYDIDYDYLNEERLLKYLDCIPNAPNNG